MLARGWNGDLLFGHQAAIDPRTKLGTSKAVEEGKLGLTISQHIDASGSGLLILGTHRKSRFVHASIGSRGAHLLTSAPTDAWIARDHRN